MKIGVLIPAYNEECVIADTIGALIVAGYSPTDIYVVNDRSTDRTEEIALSLGVHVITVPVNGGKAKAQEYALKNYGLTDLYDWIVFLDGDTKVEPNFGRVFEFAAIDNPDVSLFVGQVASANNRHIFSAYRAFEYAYAQNIIKKGQDNFSVVYVSPGCASMYKSSVLAQLHIDSNTLAEDMDLTLQVHRLGGKVKYVHDAVVVTQDPNSLKDYVKQSMRWKRGFWQTILKHRTFSFTRKQAVDWYMIYLTLESLIFNKIFLLGAAWILSGPMVIVWGLLFDLLIFSAIAFYSFTKTKRVDTLTHIPVFYLLAYVGLYVHLVSFVEIIVLRKHILAWNKVERYQFDDLVTA